MVESLYEPVRQPRRLWLQMLCLIAASYLLDSLLLALFAVSGALDGWVPLAYGAAGLAWCAVFYGLMATGVSDRFVDSNLTLAKFLSGAVLQIAFIVLAPAAALYFVGVLFAVFAFASLRLPPRTAALVWLAATLALATVLLRMPEAFNLPHETAFQRGLVGVGIVLTLARCMSLGLYNSHLRVQLARRQNQARASLDATAQRRLAMAVALHEGLGQELAGVALLLAASATATRERRRYRPRPRTCAPRSRRPARSPTPRGSMSVSVPARRGPAEAAVRPPPAKPAVPLEAAVIDALYGLEPVYEPGRSEAELSEFVTVDCPYCGERYDTPVDLTAGSFCYVEDCQVCCRPIELCGEVGAAGGLERYVARRLD
jgi:hypothetical protein